MAPANDASRSAERAGEVLVQSRKRVSGPNKAGAGLQRGEGGGDEEAARLPGRLPVLTPTRLVACE